MLRSYTSLSALVFFASLSQAQSGANDRGGCIPPTAQFISTAGDTARICQGEQVGFNADASSAAPGRTLEQWIWHVGADRDTTQLSLAIYSFNDPGVFSITLEVVDDIGCSSGATSSQFVLVSATPDFSGTLVPALACEGQSITLAAIVEQPLMIGDPVACTNSNNGVPLPDEAAASSLLQVTGQANGVLEEVAALGDICVEMEHSFMSDITLTVSCPNGQSVVLHQRGGGGTFLGDANDSDGNTVIPGTCFQYCFGVAPEFGTMADFFNINTVPVAQGIALAGGRYASVEPLTQLLGCPLNGTWSFTSFDQAGADNGYLCGWCISFGEQPDSSFVDQTPILGTTPDSSFWGGPGITNTPGQTGSAILDPVPGTQSISYTVIDSYGCEHEGAFPISVGETPDVSIENNTELGLLCAQPSGADYTYQWTYQGQLVVGANGACFTPPGNGLVSVEVESVQGCSGSASLLNTYVRNDVASAHEWVVFPSPNDGHFTLRYEGSGLPNADLRVLDMTGRVVYQQHLPIVLQGSALPISLTVAEGSYFVELSGADVRSVRRVVVR